MLQYNLGCELSYNVEENSTLLLNIGISHSSNQKIIEENFSPSSDAVEEYVHPKSKNRYIRLNVGQSNLQVSYQAKVSITATNVLGANINENPPSTLPLNILHFLYPSRYCQSDKLQRFATIEFGHLLPGYSRVTAICNWIYNNITYLSGSSDSMTSACDTVIQRMGICRDFAHLGIAFCRALNIPARFVSGYADGLNPPDFHAWFEAYLDDQWYTFDATRIVDLKSLVKVGVGRDAADVSFAMIFGRVVMTNMRVFIDQVSD